MVGVFGMLGIGLVVFAMRQSVDEALWRVLEKYVRVGFWGLNVGLLLMTCADAQQLQEGERIAFDARAGRIVRPGGQTLAAEPIPGFLLDMVEAGGLLAQLQQRFSQRTPS